MAVDAAIPEQIIMEEILPRLPIKSMLLLRCVCKSWNSQFYNPEFLSHLSRRRCSCVFQNPTGDNDDDHYLIFMNNYYCNRAPSRYFISLLSHKRLHETRIDNSVPFPLSLSEDDIHLVGSINGLVCMAFYFEGNHHFVLWNPAIRFYKKISVVGVHIPCSLIYGFGWDSVTDDYKLIAANPRNGVLSAIVYSCKTNHWTNVNSLSIHQFNSLTKYESIMCHDESIMCHCCHRPPCVIINGSPYWNYYDDALILKFDTRNNEFTYMKADFFERHEDTSLINLNDRLTCIMYSQYEIAQVYQFDEHNNTWTYMYPIDMFVNPRKFMIYGFRYGGEIVFCGETEVYSPKSDRITYSSRYPKPKCRECRGCEVILKSLVNGFAYEPSLVALPGMKALPLQGLL